VTPPSTDAGPIRLLILGGGIGGTTLAKRLANDERFAVTLVDRQNHFVFQPLLYQVATAALGAADIAVPIRHMLKRARNVRVLQAEATGIRATDRVVDTDIGPLPYDVLVVATGVEASYFGHTDWEAMAPSLKTLADAALIRERILGAFERAEAIPDPAEHARQLTFVVVGGGPTGVELAGALAELTRDTLAHDFRHIDPREARLLLVEAGPRLLPSFHPSLARSAKDDLRSRGVEVRLSTRLTALTPTHVEFAEERIPAANVIWAAGVQASPLGRALHAERDPSGRVVVAPDLSVPGHPEVFVIGDLAHFRPPEEAVALPAVGGVALQQGNHVARLLRDEVRGRPRRPFAYFDRGAMATIGRHHAIAEIGRLRFAGSFAWWLWLLVHIVFLAGFRNRLTVLLHWAWAYVTFERGARLIVRPGRVAPPPTEEL
jgi:NADH dehydrogenase